MHSSLINEEFSWSRDLIAGAFSDSVSRTISAPFDRLKYHFQVHRSQSYNMMSGAREVLKDGGIRNFWSGNAVNVMRVVPENAIKHSVFRGVIAKITEMRDAPLNSFSIMLCGGAAALVPQTIMYPFEVLRTRITLSKRGEYPSILGAVKQLYSVGGVRLFYRGFLLHLMIIIPFSCSEFAVLEACLKSFATSPFAGLSLVTTMLSGGIATSVAVATVYPAIVVRTKLHTNMKVKVKQVLIKTYKKRGFGGFYGGLGANIMKIFPTTAVNYFLFTEVSNLLKNAGL